MEYLRIIKIPLIWLIVNGVLYHAIDSHYGYFKEIAFNFIRIGAIVSAGWLLVDRKKISILSASLVGPVFIFIDHVLISSVYGLFIYDLSQLSLEEINDVPFGSIEITYFLGTVITFLILFPVSMLFAAFVAYSARSK